MYNGNIYNIYTNNRDLQPDQEYNTKKIVLNNTNDLMNIPVQQLRTAQLKNFCGTLFDQIYEEAMDIEHNQELKTQNKPSANPLKYKNNIKMNSEKSLKKTSIKPIVRKLIKKDDNNKIKDIPIGNNNRKINGNKVKSISAEKTKKTIKIIKKIKKPKKLNESDINIKIAVNLNINPNSSKVKKHNIIKSDKVNKVKNLNVNINSFDNYNTYNNNNTNNIYTNIFNFNINKIIFSIKYDTQFGEEVGILGSIPKLGNWNQNDIFYLQWNNGNKWTGEIIFETMPLDFEFKFVIVSNRNVKKWENGDNNKVYFDQLLNEIKYKKNGFFNKYEYKYDSVKGELLLICKWNY